MNIGIFTDTYEPQINGVVTSIKTLKEELESKGHTVYIVTVSHPNAKKCEENIFRLPSMPLIFAPQHRLGAFYSHKCYKKIKNLKLDLIHTHTEFSLGTFGRTIARRLKIPVIHTYHTMWESYSHYISIRKNSKTTPKTINKISELICNKYDKVITPSQKSKDALLRYGVIKPIEVVPTGINLEPFKRSNFSDAELNELKSGYGIKENEKVVVFIGRLAHEKSVDILINQFAKLTTEQDNIKLLIVGDGPARLELEHLASTLEISDKVVFTGKQPWDIIGKFYASGDIFVSASTSETQGLTFLESMASGTPVIAKYDTNLDNVITNGVNGKFFYNDHELSDILYDILSDTNTANILAENALRTAEECSSENFGIAVEELYKNVIKEFKYNEEKVS